MAHSLRPLGVHLPQMVTLGNGSVVGNYTAGTLQAFYEAVGFNPLDLPPAARPVITLKRQVAGDVAVPAILTTAAADAVKMGCWLHVQDVDHNPQHPGPDAGETEAEWMRNDLVSRIVSLDAWLTAIGADRRRVFISYGNEFDLVIPTGLLLLSALEFSPEEDPNLFGLPGWSFLVADKLA